MQSIKASIIEQITMRIVGLAVAALIIQPIIFPLYGLETTMTQNFEIALIFTVSSTIMGIIIRRIFNWFTKRSYLKGKQND